MYQSYIGDVLTGNCVSSYNWAAKRSWAGSPIVWPFTDMGHGQSRIPILSSLDELRWDLALPTHYSKIQHDLSLALLDFSVDYAI